MTSHDYTSTAASCPLSAAGRRGGRGVDSSSNEFDDPHCYHGQIDECLEGQEVARNRRNAAAHGEDSLTSSQDEVCDSHRSCQARRKARSSAIIKILASSSGLKHNGNFHGHYVNRGHHSPLKEKPLTFPTDQLWLYNSQLDRARKLTSSQRQLCRSRATVSSTTGPQSDNIMVSSSVAPRRGSLFNELRERGIEEVTCDRRQELYSSLRKAMGYMDG